MRTRILLAAKELLRIGLFNHKTDNAFKVVIGIKPRESYVESTER
jgi:hypothetical protein